jgi:hypothetical protein
VITAAALCPSPPLLHPALTGREAVLPELRAACAQAVSWLLRDDPGEIVVVGPAAATAEWDAAGRLGPTAFAPAAKPGRTDPAFAPAAKPGRTDPAFAPAAEPGRAGARLRPLPLSLGLGAMLLDQAGYHGRRRLLATGQDEPASVCAGLGASLSPASASASGQTALLVMGDGSARRSLKAPGYLDPRAAAFDAEVERAVRTGDLGALLRLDQALARDLMATGRPAWQVLAGAMGELAPVAEVLYCGDPFGVAYLVACLQPEGGAA